MLVLLAFAGSAAALPVRAPQTTPQLDLFQLAAPAFTMVGTRDGASDQVVVSVRTDHDGFVWAGTKHGLLRYEGRQWQKLDNPALDGYVDQLTLDDAGDLWAASRAFGIARHDGKRWQLEGAANGLTTRHVRRLVETDYHHGKRLWAITWDAGLLYREHGRWQADAGNAQLPIGPLLSLAQTTTLEGRPLLWVGAISGLWYRENGGTWHQLRTAGFDPGQIESLLVTRNAGREALWISVFGSGLWRLDETGLHSWTRKAGELPTDELYNIAATPAPDGSPVIWVASRSGLIRVYHDRARVFDRRYGLPSDVVRGVSHWRSPDGQDVLWLGTESGVARTILGARPWQTISLMGARALGVFGVLADTDSQGHRRLWVASIGDGLGMFSQGRWHYYTQASGDLLSSDVRMIKSAPDITGQPGLWIGTRGGYLLRIRDGPRFERIATPWPHDLEHGLNDMLVRSDGGQVEQWFATTNSGIYRLRGKTWTGYIPLGAHGQWGARQLLAQTTRDGRSWLWATSTQGLARFDGERWTLLGKNIGMSDTDLLGISLLPDAEGRPILWLGSVHAGIIRVDVSDPMRPKLLPANLPTPPDPTAYDALRDASGRIYICTDAGVQLLTSGPSGYASRSFSTRDGLINDECNSNARLLDSQGRYWTGTLGGLSVYNPGRIRADVHPKPLKLIEASVDGNAVSASDVRIPPGHHDLRVSFALLSWRREGESRFRTWLEGFDASPGAWTGDNTREIGSLPPGDFVLHIEARDYASNRSTPILLPITVVPQWWQREWVLLAALLAAGVLAYGMFRWRTLVLRQRHRLLEARIAERTLELNSANQRLLALSHRDALTDLFNRRRLLEMLQPDPSRHDTSTALIFVDVDHFKDYNDTFGHPAGDYALRVVANEMREHSPQGSIVARYGGEEFACLVFNCDSACARTAAEKIRAAIEGSPVTVPGRNELVNHVTISAGVAARFLRSEEDSRALLRDADKALYRAKREGRNCVRTAGR